MLQTTYPEFGERTFASGRHPYAMTVLEILKGAIKTPTIEVSSQQINSTYPSQINQGYLRDKKLKTLSEYPELNEPHEGWLGGVYSDTLGKFKKAEFLRLTYAEPVTATNFALWGDNVYKPSHFTISWYLKSKLVHQEIVEKNKSAQWFKRIDEGITFDKMELNVTRVLPRGGNVQLMFFGPIHRIILTPGVMRDYTIKEDLVIAGENPLGYVNANSLDLAMENVQSWFTPGYQNSPFLKLFYPRMLIHPLGGFKMKDNTYELVSLGKYYTADWGGSRASLETTLLAYDRLGNFLDQKLPPIPAYRDTKPEDFLRILFFTLGLQEGTDFQIDPRISNSPRLCWTDAMTYGEAFQQIATAGNFYISCNRAGQICAIANKGVGSAEQVFTDHDLLQDSTVPQLYKTVCNSVDLQVYKNQKGTKEQVWNSSATIPPTGTYEPNEVTYSSPVADITEIALSGVPGVVCTYFRSGVASAQMIVQNTQNVEAEVEISIKGQVISNHSETLLLGDKGADESMQLSIDNPLIQDEASARKIGNALLTFMQDTEREITNLWRPDLRTELGDVVSIRNPSHGVVQENVVVKSLQLDYNGGFNGTLITQREMG